MKIVMLLPFQTLSGGDYVLDTFTGTVIPINDVMGKVINLYSMYSMSEIYELLNGQYPEEIINGVLNFVERWVKNFSGFYVEDKENNKIRSYIEEFTNNDIKEFLEYGNVFQIVLNLTENCNLRCKYCYLSETYKYTRNRTLNEMSTDTGLKALEFYFNFLRPIAQKHPNKHIAVTFYGGEPLLSFYNLKTFIEYANKNTPLPIIYNITTNGTLLTDEIIDFLVTNKVHISISLDGNKENHDRNRKFYNEKGSFSQVIKNIKRFRERYPSYDLLSLISVYDYSSDLEEIDKFFEVGDLPPVVFVNPVLDKDTNYYEKFSIDDLVSFNTRKENLFMKYLDHKVQGLKLSSYLKTFFELSISVILYRKRHRDPINPMLPYTGSCIPGHKLSVRTDGTFDICERVNQTMPIGNITIGFDYEAISKVIKSYNDNVTNGCFVCPANKICSLCFALCMEDGKFSLDYEFCNNTRDHLKKTFSIVYSILEQKNDAFNDLEGRLSKEDPLIFFILFLPRINVPELLKLHDRLQVC